jgi:hypothetical protein
VKGSACSTAVANNLGLGFFILSTCFAIFVWGGRVIFKLALFRVEFTAELTETRVFSFWRGYFRITGQLTALFAFEKLGSDAVAVTQFQLSTAAGTTIVLNKLRHGQAFLFLPTVVPFGKTQKNQPSRKSLPL